MKALTLLQPWATLISIGAKKIETRSWLTTYKGPLAIHAAKSPKFMCLCDQRPFSDKLFREGIQSFGEVIAICELVDCLVISGKKQNYFYPVPGLGSFSIPPDEPEHSFGDYAPGRFAWILLNVRALPKPVPAKGKLGLWEWQE